MKSISIDRSKRLKDDPGTGHNRWHPDIEPIVEADPGEEVVLETRDAVDGNVVYGSEQVGEGLGGVHPLTGPVYVNGAQPGDLLEIEYLEITPQNWGFTRLGPTGGFLADQAMRGRPAPPGRPHDGSRLPASRAREQHRPCP